MEWFFYWYMFPVAILISTAAMMGGIGGAVLFSPFFLLVFPLIGAPSLRPVEAIGVALITEVFGFSSGLFGYWRLRLIDYRTGIILTTVAVPFAIIGAKIAHLIPTDALKSFFGIVMFILAGAMYYKPKKEELKMESTKALKGEYKGVGQRTCINSRVGEYCYDVCNRKVGVLLTSFGAILVGMISFGLGEIEVTQLIKRCKIPLRVATATSVFIIFITALAASLTHVYELSGEIGFDSIPWNIVAMTAPRVIIGGQIGTRLSGKFQQEKMEKFLALLFFGIGVVMTYLAMV